MGIYYPSNDSDIQASIQTMMASIDTAIASLRSRSATLNQRKGIFVYGPYRSYATGASYSLDYTGGTFDYDTGGYWSAGTPTRFNLSKGWWLLSAGSFGIPSAGSNMCYCNGIRSNSYGGVAESQLSQSPSWGGTTCMGLYANLSGTDYVYHEITYISSAGTGTVDCTNSYFHAAWIRDL